MVVVRQVVSVVLVCAVVACGNPRIPMPIRATDPVSVSDSRDCASIRAEIRVLSFQERDKRNDANRTLTKNIVLGVTGFFLLIPWFYIDLSGADTIEADAISYRIIYLQELAERRKCER